jgi:HSP20 family protein
MFKTMTKQKKSFLDKITGSQKDEEEKIKQIEIENSYKEDDDEKDVYNNRIEENIEDEEDKEWLGDEKSNKEEEGQLTVDVYQTKDLIVIKSIIGGVAPENLDISITSDMITIKGTRTNPDEVKSDDYYYQECFWGAFSRSIILPCDIKTEGVEATIKNGILTVKLPKIEKNSSMKIRVKEE